MRKKEDVNQEEQDYVLREKHGVFPTKIAKKCFFSKNNGVYKFVLFFEITENENPKKRFEQTESTNKYFLTRKKRRCCVPIFSKEKRTKKKEKKVMEKRRF